MPSLKTAGVVRPIAVGEVLRPVVGKLLCQLVHEAAREIEAAVNGTRQWLHRNSGHADKILRFVEARAHLPEARVHRSEVARWADWCYGSPSRLLFGEYVVQSCCSVQQGDFARTLQPALAGAAASSSLDLWFALEPLL